MPSIEHAHLKRAFSEVFERYYPADVAESLAVLHAQLHIEFVRGLAAVPVAEGDVRRTLQLGRVGMTPAGVVITGKERARVASALKKARGDEDTALLASTSPSMVRSELRDLMLSVGRPISLTEAEQHLRSFGVSRFRVRKAMNWWIAKGSARRIQGKTKYAKYEWASETCAGPSGVVGP